MDIQEHVSEDWETLINFLPDGWRQEAKKKGALKRCREIKDAETLLHILMIHLAQGYSLRETAVRVKQAGFANISSVGIFKRMRASGEWLRWMAEGLMKQNIKIPERPSGKLRVRLVDGTTVSEPGSTGSIWRIHYSLQLKPLLCDYFKVTDNHVGETFKLVPIEKGDLLVGDRAYSNARSVAHVLDNGGEVLVRMKVISFVLRSANGKSFKLLSRLKKLRVGCIGEWTVHVVGDNGRMIPGRICALRRSKAAIEMELKRIHRNSARHGRIPGRKALEVAKYSCVFTTVDQSVLSATDVMELYRARWQVELAFKRLKTLLNFGHLPKHDEESAKAWLFGKLLIGLLADNIIEKANSISPWGYIKILEKEKTASVCG
ncbi:MAG: IS4 family transposase [candidate division Zixibacteria bacterium]|nr:IS4 family transposase [candidate division Zixibacteria bacterium]